MPDDLMTGQTDDSGTGKDTGQGTGAGQTQTGQDQGQAGQDGTNQGQQDQTGQDQDKQDQDGQGQDNDGQQDQGQQDYEAFTVPEGMDLDTTAMDAFSPVMKDLGLSQDQAQKLVDVYAGMMQSKADEAGQAAAQFYQDRDAQWTKDLEADQDYGGENLTTTAAGVNQMLKTFDPDGDLVTVMQENALQNCAPLFKFLARVREHFSEDTFVDSNDRSKTTGDKPIYEQMGWKPLNDY